MQLLGELIRLYNNINNKKISNEEAGKIINKVFNLKIGTDNNIRGYLFNFIVKYIFDLEHENVEMNKIIQWNLQSKEIDIYFENEKFRYIVECKAWSNLQNKEIEKWINNKYQFFIDWNDGKNKNHERKGLRIYFVISFKNDLVMKDVSNRFKKYDLIKFYDQTFLYNLANKKEIRDTLKCFIQK